MGFGVSVTLRTDQSGCFFFLYLHPPELGVKEYADVLSESVLFEPIAKEPKSQHLSLQLQINAAS